MCKNEIFKNNKPIEKPVLDWEEFKISFLKNNYNENMFREDGSFNPKFNSNKKTGIIAQILEDHWDKIPEKKREEFTKKLKAFAKKMNSINYLKPANTNLSTKMKFYRVRMLQISLGKDNPEYTDL